MDKNLLKERIRFLIDKYQYTEVYFAINEEEIYISVKPINQAKKYLDITFDKLLFKDGSYTLKPIEDFLYNNAMYKDLRLYNNCKICSKRGIGAYCTRNSWTEEYKDKGCDGFCISKKDYVLQRNKTSYVDKNNNEIYEGDWVLLFTDDYSLQRDYVCKIYSKIKKNLDKEFFAYNKELKIIYLKNLDAGNIELLTQH